jgi:hypothetical protein
MIWSDDRGFYLAGQRVPAGCYVRAESPGGRTVCLERPGVLPASLDGHVAVYLRVDQTSRRIPLETPTRSGPKSPAPLD